MWQNNLDIINTLHEIATLTRDETRTAGEMAILPAQSQAVFWQSQFRPLLVKEGTLREKAIALQTEQEALSK